MRTLAGITLLLLIAILLHSIADDLRSQNVLEKKELLLHEMEIISQQCDSKSGSVNFETGDLHCNAKKQAETKQFKPTAMPNDI